MRINHKTKKLKSEKLSRSSFIVFAVLLSIAILLSSAVFLLIFCYAIALTVATSSAMVFFILFGLSLHFLALFMLCFLGISEVRTKHGLKPILSKEKRKTQAKAGSLYPAKEKSAPHAVFQFVAIVIFGMGVISVIISAGLGAISKESWTREFSSYKNSHGYYESPKKQELGFVEKPTLEIELETKFAVVIFDDNTTETKFVFYDEFEKQVRISQTDDRLVLSENKSQERDGSLEKMLFFVFAPSKNVQQIKIYIPASLKDTISIKGDYILALA